MADPPLILVVDDEQSYRDALSVALQREGFLVVTAADGAEAIDRFDATKPALVLLDVMLPKISGVDVCREIRTRSRVPITRAHGAVRARWWPSQRRSLIPSSNAPRYTFTRAGFASSRRAPLL